MAITYMQRRRSGIYEFRKMLPRALAGQVVPEFARTTLGELVNPETGRFKRELTVSLRTSDLREAKRRDAREVLRVSDLMAMAESMLASGPGGLHAEAPDMQRLQAHVVAQLLAADEEERQAGDPRRENRAGEAFPDLMPLAASGSRHMIEPHFLAYGDAVDDFARDFRKQLARRDPSHVQVELREALEALGHRRDPSAPWHHEAGLAVLRGHVEAYDLMRRRQAGDDVPTPEPAVAVGQGKGRGPLLSEAFDRWKAGSSARGARKPTGRTVLEADHAVRRFREMHGDIAVCAITREKARSFRDALARMPTRLPSDLRPLPLPRLLANPEAAKLPRPHANTVNKALTMLSAVVAAAEREGLLDAVAGFSNPFGKGVKLVVEDRGEVGREAFSPGDLTKWFSTPIYTKCERPKAGGAEAAYWLPLIALLSGARQNEIAQLRIGDLCRDEESGVWCFDIGTSGGRSIKTASSRRKVPLHPALEHAGLLRYRQSLTDSEMTLEGPLWPGIEQDSVGRRAGRWSKWFNRYLRDTAGVEEASKVFHSFRHTFKRMARDAGLSEEMHDALTGHAGAGVGRSYGGGFGLKALAAAISRIEVPPSLVGLEWSRGRRSPGAGPDPTQGAGPRFSPREGA